MELAIIKFRLFVVAELPKLKYVDWTAITKEERAECPKHEKLWVDKALPAAPLKAPALISRAPKMGAGRAGSSNSNIGVTDEQSSVLGPGDKVRDRRG